MVPHECAKPLQYFQREQPIISTGSIPVQSLYTHARQLDFVPENTAYTVSQGRLRCHGVWIDNSVVVNTNGIQFSCLPIENIKLRSENSRGPHHKTQGSSSARPLPMFQACNLSHTLRFHLRVWGPVNQYANKISISSLLTINRAGNGKWAQKYPRQG